MRLGLAVPLQAMTRDGRRADRADPRTRAGVGVVGPITTRVTCRGRETSVSTVDVAMRTSKAVPVGDVFKIVVEHAFYRTGVRTVLHPTPDKVETRSNRRLI
jgi:hypothetical protein